MTLAAGSDRCCFEALLPGDAGGKVLSAAFDQTSRAGVDPIQFDVVKISHHGSLLSHRKSPALQAIRQPGLSTAVVSSRGSSSTLPRQEVLTDYLQAGWRVYDTSRREPVRPQTEIVDLLGERVSSGGRFDVKIRWDGNAFSVEPDGAEVKFEYLPLYPTRRSSE